MSCLRSVAHCVDIEAIEKLFKEHPEAFNKEMIFNQLKSSKNNVIRLETLIQFALKFDIFNSHCHCGSDGHKKAMDVHSYLCKHGFMSWIDEKRLNQPNSLTREIKHALDHSTIVLVYISQEYMNKVKTDDGNYCRMEFLYAVENLGINRIIPVVIERDCQSPRTWQGPIKEFLSDRLYISLCDRESWFENMCLLIERVSTITTPLLNSLFYEKVVPLKCLDGLDLLALMRFEEVDYYQEFQRDITEFRFTGDDLCRLRTVADMMNEFVSLNRYQKQHLLNIIHKYKSQGGVPVDSLTSARKDAFEALKYKGLISEFADLKTNKLMIYQQAIEDENHMDSCNSANIPISYKTENGEEMIAYTKDLKIDPYALQEIRVKNEGFTYSSHSTTKNSSVKNTFLIENKKSFQHDSSDVNHIHEKYGQEIGIKRSYIDNEKKTITIFGREYNWSTTSKTNVYQEVNKADNSDYQQRKYKENILDGLTMEVTEHDVKRFESYDVDFKEVLVDTHNEDTGSTVVVKKSMEKTSLKEGFICMAYGSGQSSNKNEFTNGFEETKSSISRESKSRYTLDETSCQKHHSQSETLRNRELLQQIESFQKSTRTSQYLKNAFGSTKVTYSNYKEVIETNDKSSTKTSECTNGTVEEDIFFLTKKEEIQNDGNTKSVLSSTTLSYAGSQIVSSTLTNGLELMTLFHQFMNEKDPIHKKKFERLFNKQMRLSGVNIAETGLLAMCTQITQSTKCLSDGLPIALNIILICGIIRQCLSVASKKEELQEERNGYIIVEDGSKNAHSSDLDNTSNERQIALSFGDNSVEVNDMESNQWSLITSDSFCAFLKYSLQMLISFSNCSNAGPLIFVMQQILSVLESSVEMINHDYDRIFHLGETLTFERQLQIVKDIGAILSGQLTRAAPRILTSGTAAVVSAVVGQSLLSSNIVGDKLSAFSSSILILGITTMTNFGINYFFGKAIKEFATYYFPCDEYLGLLAKYNLTDDLKENEIRSKIKKYIRAQNRHPDRKNGTNEQYHEVTEDLEKIVNYLNNFIANEIPTTYAYKLARIRHRAFTSITNALPSFFK